ncbi:hypothetical protein BB561_000054 [Smittium simulii]|uniref:Uncharacterized protein n=1 Tax=Smittium simulii TaxID=133385 RepID=A0A2T9Z0W0_9FUNG|nr:hypothetical protein BB561_000054 [Smittium simulii]
MRVKGYPKNPKNPTYPALITQNLLPQSQSNKSISNGSSNTPVKEGNLVNNPQAGIRLQKPEQPRLGETLKLGILKENMPHDKEKRLLPVHGTPCWTIPQLPHVHKGSQTWIRVGLEQRGNSSSLSARSPNNRKNKGYILEIHCNDLQKLSILRFLTIELKVYTDESNSDWGIVLEQHTYLGTHIALQNDMHINSKELMAMLYALQLLRVVGQSVLIYSENKDTLSYVKKFWGTTSPQLLAIAENLFIDFLAFQNQVTISTHATSGIRANILQSGRRTKQTYCSNRMSLIGQQDCGSNLPEPQVDKVNKPLLLHTMESYSSDFKNHSEVRIGNVVHKLTATINNISVSNSGNGSNTRPEMRKILSNGKQTMVTDSMEDQPSTFKVQGFLDTAINILIANKKNKKRRDRYYHIQKTFLMCRTKNDTDTAITIAKL